MTEKTSMLCLSTVHLSPEADNWLRAVCNGEIDSDLPVIPKVYYPDNHVGYFVCVVPAGIAVHLLFSLPMAVRDCMRYAWKNGCDWVMFDADGPICSDLISYEYLWTK